MSTASSFAVQSFETAAGTAQQVPLEYFMQHVLPPLRSDIDPQKVVSKMRRTKNKAKRSITRAGRWRGFAEDPADIARCDEAFFLHFTKLLEAIVQCSAPRDAQTSLSLVYRRDGDLDRDHDRYFLPSAYMTRSRGPHYNGAWGDMSVLSWYSTGDDQSDCETVSGLNYSIDPH